MPRSVGKEPEVWNPVMVPRVLDIVKDELCWIFGSVYMDMSLQANILEEIQRDVTTVLEGGCGRISLVGERLTREQYVTAIIMAALGIETLDAPPPMANLKSWTSCAGMASHAEMDNVGSKADNDMDFDVPVSGLSVSTLSRLRFIDCVTVSPLGPRPRPTLVARPLPPAPPRPSPTIRPHRTPHRPTRTDPHPQSPAHSESRAPPPTPTGTFHAQVAALLRHPNDVFRNSRTLYITPHLIRNRDASTALDRRYSSRGRADRMIRAKR
ncbi:hypothetical protein JB92DRAFT_583012 [Gautieria morchelliformis]|nr:hypothetical protein JB92DRAFT_583012 [Gautieria morchelliformis]